MNRPKLSRTDLKIFVIFVFSYFIIFVLISYSYYNKYSNWQTGDIISRDIISPRFLEIKKTPSEKAFIGIGRDILEIKEKSFEEFLNNIDQYFSTHPVSALHKKEVRVIVGELLLNAYNTTESPKSLSRILEVFYNNLKLVENLTPEEKEKIWKVVSDLSKKFYGQKESKAVPKISSGSYVEKIIKPGELLIQKGTKLTQEEIRILKKLNIKKKSISVINFISIFGITLVIYILFFFYFLLFGKNFLKNLRKVSLLLTLMVLSILLGIFTLPSYFYLFPVALFSIMIAISINVNIGIAYVFTLVLLLSLIADTCIFKFFLLTMLSGTAAVYLVRHPKGRSVFTQTGIIIGILNFILILFLDIYKFNLSIYTLRNALFGFFSGFFSSVLVLGILPVIEGIFGISTSIRLLELSDPGHPLLKRLLNEAPGTYQHSALVSNLAVAAASTIGADPLLARAGGFYHDIGKLKRPHFFIENQISEKNIHDEIQPTLSTLAIISHVKDGVELAKKYNLPEEIIDIIKQHHGTSLVTYFYSRAIEKPSDKDGLTEEDFRYPGPKPQTREAAIVMLADAVEAASRTLSNPTPTKIKNLIKSIIDKIIQDGQLEESPLTFRDINLIEDTFEKFLLSMFHSRIEYPKIKTKGATNGN